MVHVLLAAGALFAANSVGLNASLEIDTKELIIGEALSGIIVVRNDEDRTIVIGTPLDVRYGGLQFIISDAEGNKIEYPGFTYGRTFLAPDTVLEAGETIRVPFILLIENGEFVINSVGDHNVMLRAMLMIGEDHTDKVVTPIETKRVSFGVGPAEDGYHKYRKLCKDYGMSLEYVLQGGYRYFEGKLNRNDYGYYNVAIKQILAYTYGSERVMKYYERKGIKYFDATEEQIREMIRKGYDYALQCNRGVYFREALAHFYDKLNNDCLVTRVLTEKEIMKFGQLRLP